jgi:arylsulfatase A-like enzyme/cytochrome c-type biogenesis protein CcmH/NrfG
VIVGLVSVGTALSAVGGWRYARASAPVSGPIVLLSVDSLRADHLPVYGYPALRTPSIDALALDGVVFERAYSHVPQTLPAHASLLIGRLPFETGVRDNAGVPIKRDERLLAEVLADRGYATAGVVSSYSLRPSTGIAQGFAFFDADMPDRSPDDPSGGVEWDGARSIAIAEAWLEKAGTERAFLFVHLHEPHAPHSPPARFSDLEPYDGEIAYVDELVGRFIKYLKAHQLYDQSTIILTGDHGEGLGDHGETAHGLLAYEEALRIPLIIKPAAGEGAGRRVEDVVEHVDIVPTVLDLAKAPLPDRLSGRSLKPLLEGASEWPARVVYSESLFGAYRFGWNRVRSVTDGRYRLVRAEQDELYDLATDRAGQHDLAADRPTELNRLRDALDEIVSNDTAADPLPPSPTASELAILGYVGSVGPADAAVKSIDRRQQIDIVETYRAAVARANDGSLIEAIQVLEGLIRRHPQIASVWHQLGDFSAAAGRMDRVIEAYRRAATLRPDATSDRLALSRLLLRLRRSDEAASQAEVALAAADDNRTARADAHELLARIALLRRDLAAAREHAALARQFEPTMPAPAFVEGRILYDANQLEKALDSFQGAIAEIDKTGAPPLPDLHYYTGDTLVRLERAAEAEYHLLRELRAYPQHLRARGALAALYHETGRTDEATDSLEAMLRMSPTPEAYSLAARLWTSFGNPSRAAAVRAEAARASTGRRTTASAAQ